MHIFHQADENPDNFNTFPGLLQNLLLVVAAVGP
jgi:hypothetical protein